MEYNLNNNPKTEKNQNSDGKKLNFNAILSFVSFFAIGFIAVAMLIALIVKGNSTASNVLRAIGESIAYIVCIILAFSWVKNHRQIPWIVCYVVFVVTIIVLYILTIQI